MYQPGSYIYNGNFDKGNASGTADIKFIKNNGFYSGSVKNGKAEGSGTYHNNEEKFRF